VSGPGPSQVFCADIDARFDVLEGESYLSRLNCEFRDHIRALREAQRISIRYAFRGERENWIQVMAAAGMGFCVLPEYSPIIPGVMTRPIIEPEIVRDVLLVTVSGRRFSPVVATFVRDTKSYRWPN
jgi:DNA-binding transcriptional LysR family regulator